MLIFGNLTFTGISAPKKQPDEDSFFGELILKLSNQTHQTRELLFVFDPSKEDRQFAKKRRSSVRVAILMEPPVVLPSNGIQDNFKDFDLVFELGRLKDDVPQGHIALPWPQQLAIHGDIHNENRTKECAMVCGNKFSFIPGELYSLRRKIIRRLTRKVDLFGTGWESKRSTNLLNVLKAASFAILNGRFSLISFSALILSKPRNFLGQPKNKLATLQNYESSIVIENWEKCFTEKLFDALKAGCLPIYIGPPLEKIGIPEGFAIQAPSQYSKLVHLISNSTHKLEGSKRKDIESWLCSSQNPHLYKNVASEIVKHLESKQLR